MCAVRVCEGDGNAGVGSGEAVVAVSAYMGGTHGSGVLARKNLISNYIINIWLTYMRVLFRVLLGIYVSII